MLDPVRPAGGVDSLDRGRRDRGPEPATTTPSWSRIVSSRENATNGSIRQQAAGGRRQVATGGWCDRLTASAYCLALAATGALGLNSRRRKVAASSHTLGAVRTTGAWTTAGCVATGVLVNLGTPHAEQRQRHPKMNERRDNRRGKMRERMDERREGGVNAREVIREARVSRGAGL